MQKWLTAFSRQLHSQNVPSQMFDKVPNTPLLSSVELNINQIKIKYVKYINSKKSSARISFQSIWNEDI